MKIVMKLEYIFVLAILVGIGIFFVQLNSYLISTEETKNIVDESNSITFKKYDPVSGISVFHDSEYNVTCWRNTNYGSISCLPDFALKQVGD